MKNSILILLLVSLIASCKKEDTVWETEWSAPIVNDTLTLANLVNDSTLVESSGFYELDLNRTLFDFDINEFVKIPDTTIQKVYTNGSFSNFLVVAGQSFFNTAPSEEYDLALEDVELKKIILKKGNIEVTIANPFTTKAYFSIFLPGFMKDGSAFNYTYEAPAGSVASPGVIHKIIDLSGYEIDLTGESGVDFNKVVAEFDVISDPNGPDVNFGNEHNVPVNLSFNGIELDYARGYFGNRVISDTTDLNLEALDIYESGLIDLSALSLSFNIENGIKVGAQGILHTVSNENALGNTVQLSGSSIGNAFSIAPATGIWNTLTPSLSSLQFTSGNSNIENYLENLGSKHSIGYSLQLNPWGNTSGSWDEIFPQSALRVKLKAQMPLSIGLDDLVLKDTFEVSLNQDPAKTRIISGELLLNTSNAFPFSADVTVLLLNANGAILHTINGSEKIEASQFGNFNSTYNFNIANSQVSLVLSDEMVEDINDVTHIVVKSKFNSIDAVTNTSEQMNIPIDAFLSVKLRTKFKSENRF